MKRLILLVAFILTFSTAALAAEVPPTIPHPGINGENGFVISVFNRDTRILDLRAPYLHDTPYDNGSGWVNGDRIGYKCGYAFIQHSQEIFGRVTFRLLPGADVYMQINDTYMEEPNSAQNTAGGPSRFYDGSVNSTGQQASSLECPAVTEDYNVAPRPDERDKAVFWLDGLPIEIRDYLFADAAEGVTFNFLDPIAEPFTVTGTDSGESIVNNRQGVLIFDHGIPVAVVYYDGIGRGSVLPSVEPVPNDDCNAIISMSQGAQVYAGSQAGAGDTADSELEAATGEEWMLLFAGGKPLKFWASAALWNSLSERHRCGTDAEIDRVLFIFDPRGSANPWSNDLNKAIAIMQSRYPNAEIDVSLLVGADGHAVCTINQRGRTVTVTATQTHNNANAATVAAHPNAGPDLDVSCSGFADALGHLNNGGAADAQSQVADFYD